MILLHTSVDYVTNPIFLFVYDELSPAGTGLVLDYNCHNLKTGQTPGCNLPKGYGTSIIDDSFDYSVVMKYFINFSWKIYLLAD